MLLSLSLPLGFPLDFTHFRLLRLFPSLKGVRIE